MDLAGSVEYWFGAGDGAVTSWHSPAYGGAAPLDFDGDGRADDLMLDIDGDGRADFAALDLDDDAVTEAWFTDDGAGTWAHPATPLCGSAPGPGAMTEPGPGALTEPGPGALPGRAPSGPLAPDAPLIVWTPAAPGSGARQAFVDVDGDGAADVVLFDADGDGRADGAVTLPRENQYGR